MFLFKNKPYSQGFTMVDVLTAILMTTMFFSVSLQTLMVGTIFRVKAQQKQEVNFWIQEDMERIQLIASRGLEQNNQKCNASTYSDGYAKALADVLPTPATHTLFKKNYRIDRIYDTGSSVVPHQVLKIAYEVKEWNGSQFIGESIANDYWEVIPHVALSCY
jgi:hypothetical protein